MCQANGLSDSPSGYSVDAAREALTQRHHEAQMPIVFLSPTPESLLRVVENPDRRTYYKTNHSYTLERASA